MHNLYVFFVGGAFGISFLGMLLMGVHTARQHKKWQRQVRALQAGTHDAEG